MSAASATVFHHVPSPISLAEFRDAVQAVCPPRFPNVCYAQPRRIALAVSGGADSMAMAYLFSRLLRTHKCFHIADNPASRAYGIIVDHKLRDGSTNEAAGVASELARHGLRSVVRPLRWGNLPVGSPVQLPDVESRARSMRYQVLGSICHHLQTTSLFLAHHRDDQYETVLMRLLAGHGLRGLRGIRAANAIPECYQMHGVYKSGLLDDQLRSTPYLSFRPSNRELKRLRSILMQDSDDHRWDRLQSFFSLGQMYAHLPGHVVRPLDSRVPYLAPLSFEEGGVMVYRPLLEFDKDRLVATCEANHVRWFEDSTNAMPTLTTRNAVRHMVRTHQLPRALQKPAVVALSKRASQKADADEAEARRLLSRHAVIQAFDPNAGTLLVRMPSLGPVRRLLRRPFAVARERARRRRRRLLAAMAIRSLVDFVTPDLHLPPLANLDKFVDRLFPAPSPRLGRPRPPSPPKAFSVAGVLFQPASTPHSWLLSRAPYPSTQPLPERQLHSRRDGTPFSFLSPPGDDAPPPGRPARWRGWKTAQLWDGRFWLRVTACAPARLHVLPFLADEAKRFRSALGPDLRAKLEQRLSFYAPGKVRYSLPAIYSVDKPPSGASPRQLTLLALPSLHLHVPGLERWVKYEARYKKVDAALLSSQRRPDHGTAPSPPRSRRPLPRPGPLRRGVALGSRRSSPHSRRRRRRRRRLRIVAHV